VDCDNERLRDVLHLHAFAALGTARHAGRPRRPPRYRAPKRPGPDAVSNCLVGTLHGCPRPAPPTCGYRSPGPPDQQPQDRAALVELQPWRTATRWGAALRSGGPVTPHPGLARTSSRRAAFGSGRSRARAGPVPTGPSVPGSSTGLGRPARGRSGRACRPPDVVVHVEVPGVEAVGARRVAAALLGRVPAGRSLAARPGAASSEEGLGAASTAADRREVSARSSGGAVRAGHLGGTP